MYNYKVLVCLIFCLGLLEVSQCPAGGLQDFSIIPPVSTNDWTRSGQDYAEYGDVVKDKFHTGLDMTAARGTDIVSVYKGEVYLIQLNDEDKKDDGTLSCAKGGANGKEKCSDGGFGNTIIMRHKLPDGTYVYSQYSHLKKINKELLKSIDCEPDEVSHRCHLEKMCDFDNLEQKDKCINSKTIDSNTKLGTLGASAYGQDPYTEMGSHLHFELKTDPHLINVKTENLYDKQTLFEDKHFGYTADHPSTLSYLDPALYIAPKPQDLEKEIAVFVTNAGNAGEGLKLRGGPSIKYEKAKKETVPNKFKAYRFAQSNRNCSLGWYQIHQKTTQAEITDINIETRMDFDYSAAKDAEKEEMSKIDEAWVCIGNNKEVWVSPTESEVSSTNENMLFAIALIIDRSPSMKETALHPDGSGSEAQKLESAKQATKAFILSLDNSRNVAISSFDGQGKTDLTLSSVSSVRQTIDQTLEKISVVGWGTNIGAGLEKGYLELQKAGKGSNHTALLLTDGQNTVGDFSSSVNKYKTNGFPICTIGFGKDADETTLRKIATETGCTYTAAETVDIVTRYQELAAYANNESSNLSANDLLTIKGQLIYEFVVSKDAKHLDANLSWPGSMLKTILVAPNGSRIEDTAIGPDQGRYVEGKTFQMLEINNPVPGKWRIELSWKDAPPSAEQVNILVTEKTDVFARIHGLKSQYSLSQTVDINTDAFEVVNNRKIPLQNASVKIEVKKPGEEIVRLIQAQSTSWTMYKDVLADIRRDVTMFDDGAHTDYKSSDGIFGGSFTETDKNGVYLITATINGKKQSGEAVQKTIMSTFQVGSIMNNPVSTSKTMHFVQQVEDHINDATPVSTGLLQQPLNEIEKLQQGSDPLDEINKLLQ